MPINRVLDDWFGLDPNGGGVFDSRTGLLGHQVDITAPGVQTTQGQNPFFQQTSPHIAPALGEAQELFQAGAAPLNPLLEGYYNRTAGLLDGNQRTQQLASQAAARTAGPFAGAGTIGGARHAAAANQAAANALLAGQRQDRLDLAQAGQQYQDWQDTADWQNLQRYQQATGFGQAVPTSQTVTETPSGADILSKQIAHDLLRAQLAEQGISSAQSRIPGGGALGQIGQVGQVLGAVPGIVDAASSVWDNVSGWFNEGGEVHANPAMNPRPAHMSDPAEDAWDELNKMF